VKSLVKNALYLGKQLSELSIKYYSKEEGRANTCWGRGREDACSRSLCSALVQ